MGPSAVRPPLAEKQKSGPQGQRGRGKAGEGEGGGSRKQGGQESRVYVISYPKGQAAAPLGYKGLGK